MRLLLIVLLPFLGSCLPLLLARAGRKVCALGTGIFTLLSLALLLTHYGEVVQQEQLITQSWPWVPQLGLQLSLSLDGLGFLLVGLILGIGLLIIVYAAHYLSAADNMGEFFTYLLIFQGAMVGIAMSSNVLLLVVFWELTSLASFLLIGFWKYNAAARQGARMALIVTGGGGLALTGGLILLGQIAGSYELPSINAQRELIQASPWYPWVVVLVAIGCFTKSAQFPFHFWLPQAMSAPTPISAYLHSATMVKAGVFLLARLWPILSGTEVWFYLVTTTGAITMLCGGFVALSRTDLKSLLAYSTVSHLGLMTMLLGLGTTSAVVAAVFHLLNHALFKAALFMNVGTIDHVMGTRDWRRLRGLAVLMPAAGLTALLGLAANAGLPPLNGFLSKELMLEQAWAHPFAGLPSLLGVVAIIAGALSLAYSLNFFLNVYGGTPASVDEHWHAPSWGLVFPAFGLAVLSLAIGIFPGTLAEPLVRSAAQSATRSQPLPAFHLQMWHGWNLAAQSSLVAIALGIGLYAILRWRNSSKHNESMSDQSKGFGTSVFWAGNRAMVRCTQATTDFLQHGILSGYITTMLLALLALGVIVFWNSPYESGTRPLLPVQGVAWLVLLMLVAACLATLAFHRERLLSLIAANVVGLISCIGFIYLSAPDLALTQIAVEVVTLILLLLAMYFLPKESPREVLGWRWRRDIAIAGAVGLAMAALTWMVVTRNFDSPLANFFIEQSKPAGGGANVVNVILVDFRGFDTFNEIAVLGIAALAIYGLLDGAMHGPAAGRLNHWKSERPQTPQKHPTLMMSATRVMLPLALLVGTFMFLRGHNHPGGGFVAGLVITIALIMQYMVNGYQWAADRITIDYHGWIGTGLLIAAATGVTAMVMDYPFLTNAHEKFEIPWLGKLELSSALAFDAGVLLTVVGAVMLTLANLSRLGRRAEQAAQRLSDEERMRSIASTTGTIHASTSGEFESSHGPINRGAN